ncbi:MAG TPA: extracellular solute-binding protein [Actinomycetota bacterium]|nr:extracellular solute-binding protein [Actinomycetota bacterium]
MRARTILVALLVVLLLIAVGCGGGSGKEDSGSSLTFWTAEDNPDRVKATQAIIDRFTQQTNIKVKLVAINEDQLSSQVNSASAAGTLPDVLAAASLGFVHSLAADNITDPDAAAAVINTLGRQTFSRRALSLVEANGTPVAVPSDSWTQLLVYRTDLFAKAGLAAPTTFEAIQAAAAKLTSEGMAGIVAATTAGDSFTQQTFEYLAVANDCQLVDQAGAITLTSRPCVDTFQFYVDLIRIASVQGRQDATSTRAAYLAGKAAMVIWSSFLLDELAGLSNDARPSCPQCHRDSSFLADHSGIVTAIMGPDGTEASQFGELTCFAITKDASKDAAKLVEFLMDDGYLDWLGLAPEGKVPVRTGTTDQPTKFTDAWTHLQTGVENRKPLSELYPPGVLKVLATSTDTMNRWGFAQDQGRLVGAQLATLPIPKALAAALNGTLSPAAAAEQAQADLEEIAQTIN